MTEKNLEKVFQDALGHYEADVNPALWQSVQSGLAGKAAASSAASGASQAGQVITGLGAKGILWIAGAVVAAAGGLYLAVRDPEPAAQKPLASAAQEIRVEPSPVTVVEKPAGIPIQEARPVTQQEQRAVVQPAKKDLQQEIQPPMPAGARTEAARNEPQASAPETALPPPTKPESNAAQPPVEKPAPLKEESIQEPAPVTEASFEAIEKYLLPDQNGQARLPNKFTPNGDGYNDEFTILTQGLKSLEVIVFNQAGVVVFRWNDLQGRWNGLLASGKAAPPGTYFYSVKARTPEDKISIGYSTLVLSEK